MNKGYAAGNVERTAKEVLASMQVVCPDRVWLDLSLELEQTNGASDSKFKNKLSTPQTLVLVLLVLAGSTFFLWKYMAGKNNTPITYKTPPPSQIIKPAPQPPVQSKPIALVKDTATLKPANMPPAQNTPIMGGIMPVVQNTIKKQGLNTPFPKHNLIVKKDSVAAANTVGENTAPPPRRTDTTGISNVIQAITHDTIN